MKPSITSELQRSVPENWNGVAKAYAGLPEEVTREVRDSYLLPVSKEQILRTSLRHSHFWAKIENARDGSVPCSREMLTNGIEEARRKNKNQPGFSWFPIGAPSVRSLGKNTH